MRKILVLFLVGVLFSGLFGCATRKTLKEVVRIQELQCDILSAQDQALARKDNEIIEVVSKLKSDVDKLKFEKFLAKEDIPRVHTVGTWAKDRACLWNIAKKLYGNAWLWKKIFNTNKNKIKNPDLIYPGQKLIIP